MLQHLLWAEILLKGGIGVLLVISPGYTASVTGLPQTANGFWPRLFGAGLLGVAASLLMQGLIPAVKTITLAGIICLNLTGITILVALLVLGKAAETRRGRALLWLFATGHTLLCLFEIAYA